jgi:predicted branched-subunit amino acid permease
MMALLELIEGIVELWCSWRFYLCLAVGLGVAVLLHHLVPDQGWVYLMSVPLVIAALVGGWRWQVAADFKRD